MKPKTFDILLAIFLPSGLIAAGILIALNTSLFSGMIFAVAFMFAGVAVLWAFLEISIQQRRTNKENGSITRTTKRPRSPRA